MSLCLVVLFVFPLNQDLIRVFSPVKPEMVLVSFGASLKKWKDGLSFMRISLLEILLSVGDAPPVLLLFNTSQQPVESVVNGLLHAWPAINRLKPHHFDSPVLTY